MKIYLLILILKALIKLGCVKLYARHFGVCKDNLLVPNLIYNII